MQQPPCIGGFFLVNQVFHGDAELLRNGMLYVGFGNKKRLCAISREGANDDAVLGIRRYARGK